MYISPFWRTCLSPHQSQEALRLCPTLLGPPFSGWRIPVLGCREVRWLDVLRSPLLAKRCADFTTRTSENPPQHLQNLRATKRISTDDKSDAQRGRTPRTWYAGPTVVRPGTTRQNCGTEGSSTGGAGSAPCCGTETIAFVVGIYPRTESRVSVATGISPLFRVALRIRERDGISVAKDAICRTFPWRPMGPSERARALRPTWIRPPVWCAI